MATTGGRADGVDAPAVAAAVVVAAACFKSRSVALEAASQTRTVPSSDPDTSSEELAAAGEAREVTAPEWPESTAAAPGGRTAESSSPPPCLYFSSSPSPLPTRSISKIFPSSHPTYKQCSPDSRQRQRHGEPSCTLRSAVPAVAANSTTEWSRLADAARGPTLPAPAATQVTGSVCAEGHARKGEDAVPEEGEALSQMSATSHRETPPSPPPDSNQAPSPEKASAAVLL